MLILDSKVLNDQIIKVLNIADERNLKYEKSDLVLFAKDEIMKGNKDPNYIVTVYAAIK